MCMSSKYNFELSLKHPTMGGSVREEYGNLPACDGSTASRSSAFCGRQDGFWDETPTVSTTGTESMENSAASSSEPERAQHQDEDLVIIATNYTSRRCSDTLPRTGTHALAGCTVFCPVLACYRTVAVPMATTLSFVIVLIGFFLISHGTIWTVLCQRLHCWNHCRLFHDTF